MYPDNQQATHHLYSMPLSAYNCLHGVSIHKVPTLPQYLVPLAPCDPLHGLGILQTDYLGLWPSHCTTI